MMTTNSDEIINCNPLEAQVWCNFVLFEVKYLPEGFHIAEFQLRKENEKHSFSVRYKIENENHQAISIKQFLYDWAPPAYDYPCLWLNTKKYDPKIVLPPRPILINSRVLWVGKNYRGQNGATIDLERTRIEITFDGVNLSDEELIKIVKSLKPCSQLKRAEILDTPFSKLSYFSRFKKEASDVPLSYWRHFRSKSCYLSPLFIENDIESWLPNGFEKEINDVGYKLNSVFKIKNFESDDVFEKEYLFEHNQFFGVFIHLVVTPIYPGNPIKFPPEIGDQICEYHRLDINENEVYYAYSQQVYGNYEFVWKDKKSIYLMIIRAAKWVTYDWVFNLINKII